MELDQDNFDNATLLVINNFEGGYYHPYMIADLRIKTNEKQRNFLRNSGETMFGLDRSAGHSLYYSSAKKTDDVFQNLQYIPYYKFKNQASADFWTILDNNNASTNWKWNYYGGINENKLKKLASKILFPQFKKYVDQFKWSDKTKQIVYNDPKLLFHFIYAIWNGSGFFQKWSKKLNEDVANGLSNNQILQNQLNLRSISASGTDLSAGKMVKLFNSPEFDQKIIDKKKILIVIPLLILIGGVYLLIKNKK